MASQEYSVKITKLSPEMGGCYIAEVEELPGCIADGETPQEALNNVDEAINLWIEVQQKSGRSVPAPKVYENKKEYNGKISLRTSKTLHETLVKIAETEGVSLNSFINDVLSERVGFLKGCNEVRHENFTQRESNFITRERRWDNINFPNFASEGV